MNNMILAQMSAQSTSEFHINFNSVKFNPSLSYRLSNSSTKSPISIYSARKYINVNQTFIGHGISDTCFHKFHFRKTSLARSAGAEKCCVL